MNRALIGNAGTVLLCLLQTYLVFWLGFLANRSDFPQLFAVYSLAFLLYFILIFRTANWPFWSVLLLGLIYRAILIYPPPLLSDDIYRFIWDGRLWTAGIHPFSVTPEALMAQQTAIPGIDQHLYGLLNSQKYYTVYPPVNQFIFWLSARFSPINLQGGWVVIKSALFLSEVGLLLATQRLLQKLPQPPVSRIFSRFPVNWLAVVAFNPLLIVETLGNGHFESMMVFFLLLGLLSVQAGKQGWSGFFWALAVAVKLLPILFLPVIVGWLRKSGRIRFIASFTLTSLLLFIPLLDLDVLRNMGSSVRLYFQQFEFNASLYYFISHITPFFTGWYEGRTVSLVLAQITLSVSVGLGWRFWRSAKNDISELHLALFAVAALYLLNATTVHSWYVLVPFLLSIGTGYGFPLVWTWLVLLSYSHYHQGAYLENFWLIGLEYIVLFGVIIWELGERFRVKADENSNHID